MFSRHLFRKFSEKKTDFNWTMIRREMIADVIQTCLKYTAYSLSNSQAVKAELMRAGLDAVNHVFMLAANKWSKYQPDEKYNYGKDQLGYSKFKNITVIIPGFCFALSGVYNVVFPIMSLMGGLEEMPELNFNFLSLSIIFLQSFGEFYLYYKNLGDVSLNEGMKGFFQKLMIRSRLSWRIIMKKESVDPIQDAIITENVLAVLGVTMPVATSFLCYLTGLAWLDLVGEMCNGVVQIYLGYLICRENTHILMGKGVQKLDFDKILQILKSRKEVKDVIDLKTKWSNEVLLISATVNYDEGKIAENITEALDADIIKITSDEAKQKKLKNLILKSTFEFIHHTDNLVKTMEKDVRKYYPNAEFIDIEKCHSNIQSAHKGSISSSFRKNK